MFSSLQLLSARQSTLTGSFGRGFAPTAVWEPPSRVWFAGHSTEPDALCWHKSCPTLLSSWSSRMRCWLHDTVLQTRRSIVVHSPDASLQAVALQSLPPCCGGSFTYRVRYCVPLSQSLLQPDQGLQSLQTQSTGHSFGNKNELL